MRPIACNEKGSTHEVRQLLGGTWINVEPIRCCPYQLKESTDVLTRRVFNLRMQCVTAWCLRAAPFAAFPTQVKAVHSRVSSHWWQAGSLPSTHRKIKGFSQGSPCFQAFSSYMLICRSWWRARILHIPILSILHVAVAACYNWRSKEGKELYTEAKKIYQSRRPNVPCRAVWSRISIDGDKKQLFLFEDKVRPLRFWTCDRRAAFPNSDVNSPHIQMHGACIDQIDPWNSLKGSRRKSFKLRPMQQLCNSCSMFDAPIWLGLGRSTLHISSLLSLFHVKCGKWMQMDANGPIRCTTRQRYSRYSLFVVGLL